MLATHRGMLETQLNELVENDHRHIEEMEDVMIDRLDAAIAARMLVRPRGAPAETALASSQGSGTHSPEDTRVPDVNVTAPSGTRSPEDARRGEENAR